MCPTSAFVPVSCAVLKNSNGERGALMYNFEQVKPALDDLQAHLNAVAAERLWPDVAAALAEATGVPTMDVGLALSELLPNVITPRRHSRR